MQTALTRKKLLPLILLCILSTGIGCGSGSDSSSTFAGEYTGAWDARYNISIDECALTESGAIAFVDLHIIRQSEDTVTLEASMGGLDPLIGTLTESNSFTVEGLITGDYFGDGTECDVFEKISYTPRDNDQSDSLFLREISCNDGFICTTRAVGLSTRTLDEKVID